MTTDPRVTREKKAGWRDSPRPPFPVRLALGLLRFYQVYLSILFAGSCRFEPTCSRFAYGAIERFGVRRGVWLGGKRLLRCHPLSGRFGYDPVPEAWPDSSSAPDGPPPACGRSAAIASEVHS